MATGPASASRAAATASAVILLLSMLVFAAPVAATAPAAPSLPQQNGLPTAAVSLGDSFISGEAGRWEGNSNDGFDPDRDGTDRAYRSGWWGTWWYNYNAVYPGRTYWNGCHRSDVAEIHSADLGLDHSFNLACSGARTEHIFRSSNGGKRFRGEEPQADRLAALAQDYDIELVVLSIGGNDLGFSGVITACVASFSTGAPTCNAAEQAKIDAKMAAVMADVDKAITEIQEALSSAGQEPGSYRLILQSYPSPIPRAAEIRYPEHNWQRLNIGGCPLWDADADWARDSLVPEIDANLRAVADGAGTEFLSLANAFDGREICATSSSLVNGDRDTPSSASHEWVRFLVSGLVQGQLQESVHPNAFGQQALGSCLALAWQAAGTDRCDNVPGANASQMTLSGL